MHPAQRRRWCPDRGRILYILSSLAAGPWLKGERPRQRLYLLSSHPAGECKGRPLQLVHPLSAAQRSCFISGSLPPSVACEAILLPSGVLFGLAHAHSLSRQLHASHVSERDYCQLLLRLMRYLLRHMNRTISYAQETGPATAAFLATKFVIHCSASLLLEAADGRHLFVLFCLEKGTVVVFFPYCFRIVGRRPSRYLGCLSLVFLLGSTTLRRERIADSRQYRFSRRRGGLCPLLADYTQTWYVYIAYYAFTLYFYLFGGGGRGCVRGSTQGYS